jgi:hypothetical protein
LGLLIAGKLTHDAQKSAGWAPLTVGGLTMVPLVMDILGKPRLAERGQLAVRLAPVGTAAQD